MCARLPTANWNLCTLLKQFENFYASLSKIQPNGLWTEIVGTRTTRRENYKCMRIELWGVWYTVLHHSGGDRTCQLTHLIWPEGTSVAPKKMENFNYTGNGKWLCHSQRLRRIENPSIGLCALFKIFGQLRLHWVHRQNLDNGSHFSFMIIR
jgi:hypothetical protein